MAATEDLADDHAAVAAAGAAGANHRQMNGTLSCDGQLLTALDSKLDDTIARLCSLQAGWSEIKELVIEALERP